MSLEDSMKELAASNLKLATSFDRYADVVEKYGLQIREANGDAAPATPAKETKPAAAAASGGKGGKAKPAAAKPAAETKDDDDAGDDGFGDDNGGDDDGMPTELTAEIIKAKLFEVKDSYGDKEPALAIIRKLGYNAIPDVKAKDFEKVYKACVKALKDNE